MHIGVEYTIFKTKWGYFGLAGAESGIFRTHLPAHAQDSVKIALLARRAGRANAARAVGAVMAANPLPLLIPCHRVLRSDGQIGGFSAGEGVELKKKLLGHEKCCLAQLIAAGSRVL